ncbi:MAG: hypothetical protein HYV29_11775 [Ignavibacteriales bacterium]|nr:hypothetical protein [Ignavibacteriales bacterium]
MKTIGIIPSLAIIFIALNFSSCKSNFTSSNDDIEGILPLAVGNTWIYRTNYSFGVPSIDSTFQMDTMTVVRDSMIGNERWFAIHYSLSASHQITGENYYINRIDGLYILYLSQQFGSHQDPSIDHLIKYPSNIGDSIVNSGSIIKLTSMTDTVTVDQAQITCHTYQVYNSARDTTVGYNLIYLNPNVGIVKTDTYSSSNKLGSSRRLLTYSLK